MNLKNKIKYYVKQGDNAITELLLPSRCPVCDDIVSPRGELVCSDCLGTFKPILPPYCAKCGRKIDENGDLCDKCMSDMGRSHNFDAGRALYEYDTVADAIFRFKYRGRQEYAKLFAHDMAIYLSDFIKMTKAEALIPIPIHKERLAVRGYNQAEVLAKELSKETKIPVYDNLLIRKRNTKVMKELSVKMRQNNLKNAFTINGNDVKLKVAIVVDDIYTTGATIDEASAVLKAAGINRVYFLTLSCGAGI